MANADLTSRTLFVECVHTGMNLYCQILARNVLKTIKYERRNQIPI